MSDILKRLQTHVDFLAETGRKTTEVSFDDLNDAVGEIERLDEISQLISGIGETWIVFQLASHNQIDAFGPFTAREAGDFVYYKRKKQRESERIQYEYWDYCLTRPDDAEMKLVHDEPCDDDDE